MSTPLRVINLGLGVQSSVVAARVAVGEDEPVHCAIHADTTHERAGTYEYAKWFIPWLEERGVRVVVVKPEEPEIVKIRNGWCQIPVSTAKGGKWPRECTPAWKSGPIKKWLREELKRLGLKKSAGAVTQLMGISLDEFQRAKTSDVKWTTLAYPLLDARMTRYDCEMWLKSHGLPVPPKSACVFCPYHSKTAWQELKRAGGSDWEQAVAVDEMIRNHSSSNVFFLHSSRKPLTEAVVIPEDFNMTILSFLDEDDVTCDSGHCFL